MSRHIHARIDAETKLIHHLIYNNEIPQVVRDLISDALVRLDEIADGLKAEFEHNETIKKRVNVMEKNFVANEKKFTDVTADDNQDIVLCDAEDSVPFEYGTLGQRCKNPKPCSVHDENGNRRVPWNPDPTSPR